MLPDSSKVSSTNTAVWSAIKSSIGLSLEKGPIAFSKEHITPWKFESDCLETKWDTKQTKLYLVRGFKSHSLPCSRGLTIYHEATTSYIKASANSHEVFKVCLASLMQ